jgi:hypothetical protein
MHWDTEFLRTHSSGSRAAKRCGGRYGIAETNGSALNALNGLEYERLAAEQAKLFFFYPMMTHSLQETAGLVYFHPQVLADFGVVEEIALRMLAALRGA